MRRKESGKAASLGTIARPGASCYTVLLLSLRQPSHREEGKDGHPPLSTRRKGGMPISCFRYLPLPRGSGAARRSWKRRRSIFRRTERSLAERGKEVMQKVEPSDGNLFSTSAEKNVVGEV